MMWDIRTPHSSILYNSTDQMKLCFCSTKAWEAWRTFLNVPWMHLFLYILAGMRLLNWDWILQAYKGGSLLYSALSSKSHLENALHTHTRTHTQTVEQQQCLSYIWATFLSMNSLTMFEQGFPQMCDKNKLPSIPICLFERSSPANLLLGNLPKGQREISWRNPTRHLGAFQLLRLLHILSFSIKLSVGVRLSRSDSGWRLIDGWKT